MCRRSAWAFEVRAGAVVALTAAAALTAACNGHAKVASSTVSPGRGGTGFAPVTARDRGQAAAGARTYVDLLTSHRLSEARVLTAAGTPAARRSLLDLETWLTSLPSEDHRVIARSVDDSAYPVRTRVALDVRVGPPRGSPWLRVGRWTFASVDRAGSWRVIRELDGGRVAVGGLINFRIPVSVTGHRGTVVTGSLDDKPDARMIVRVLDAAAPGLARRYGHSRAVDRPVVLLASSPDAARLVCDCWFPKSAVAVSTDGLIVVSLASWSAYGRVMRAAIIVHELAHSAMTGALKPRHLLPTSLEEGVASFEEYRYAARHGLMEPLGDLAAAYRAGYPSERRWRSTLPRWGLTNLGQIRLAYADALAIVHAVATQHGGVAAVMRLAAAFDRLDRTHGPFTPSELESAFQSATGASFERIAQEASAWVAARAAAEASSGLAHYTPSDGWAPREPRRARYAPLGS